MFFTCVYYFAPRAVSFLEIIVKINTMPYITLLYSFLKTSYYYDQNNQISLNDIPLMFKCFTKWLTFFFLVEFNNVDFHVR